MNQEDYEAAMKFKLRRGGKVYKVHGVGIDLSEYDSISIDKEKIRLDLGLKNTDIVCISAGDIVARKNYGVAIEAIAKANNYHLHYLICGEGPEKDRLERKVKNLGVSRQVHFLGFRTDIKELMKASDIFLLTSLQEGLPRSLMEAMAVGLPIICSRIRGNVDLVEDGKGGYLCEINDSEDISKAITRLANSPTARILMSKANLDNIKYFDYAIVETEIRDIYKEVLK